MFQVRDLGGIQRLYEPGQIRVGRGVEPIFSALAAAKIAGESTHHGRQQQEISRHYGTPQENEVPQEVKFAREIMTHPVVVVTEDTRMSEVNMIFTSRRFRHLPVLSENKHLVGLISDRDTLRFGAKVLRENLVPDRIPVSSVMVTGILTATSDTLIRDIARIMFEERIGSIPIVDSEVGVEGIITRSDILRALLIHGPIHLWA